MLSNQEVLEAAHTLNKLGVGFYMEMPHPCGAQEIFIKLDELQEALKETLDDRDVIIAKKFGVTKDHYRRWLEFIENPQCAAVTKKGQQCKNPCWWDEKEITTPDKFDPTCNYFCPTHSEYTEAPSVYIKK